MSTDYRTEDCEIEFRIARSVATVQGELFLGVGDGEDRSVDFMDVSWVDAPVEELAQRLVAEWNIQGAQEFSVLGWDQELPSITIEGPVYPHEWIPNTYRVSVHVLFDYLETL